MIADIYYAPELQDLILKNNLGSIGRIKHAWAININLFGSMCWGKISTRSSRLSESIEVKVSHDKFVKYKFKSDAIIKFNKFVACLSVKVMVDGVVYGHIVEIMNVIQGNNSISNPEIIAIVKQYNLLCNAGNTYVYAESKETVKEIYTKGIEYIMATQLTERDQTILDRQQEITDLQEKFAADKLEQAKHIVHHAEIFKSTVSDYMKKIDTLNTEARELKGLIAILMKQRNDLLGTGMICYKIPVAGIDMLMSMEFRGGSLLEACREFCETNVDEYIYYVSDGYDMFYERFYYDTFQAVDIYNLVPETGKDFTGSIETKSNKKSRWSMVRIPGADSIVSFDDPSRLLKLVDKKMIMSIFGADQ